MKFRVDDLFSMICFRQSFLMITPLRHLSSCQQNIDFNKKYWNLSQFTLFLKVEQISKIYVCYKMSY